MTVGSLMVGGEGACTDTTVKTLYLQVRQHEQCTAAAGKARARTVLTRIQMILKHLLARANPCNSRDPNG